jgi:excinuclease ABC subunit B
LDPEIFVKPTDGQIDDIISEIHKVTEKNERVLITTLTKRMAEDLTKYLTDADIKVRYLHSDIDTIERMEIIRDLRIGEFDVLIGINLLREGLDLPEVSLVCILDADKQGFLRSENSLIQTIGRAARNSQGRVIMYADELTPSMEMAIAETQRRRKIQDDYNKANGITPKTIIKPVKNTLEITKKATDKQKVKKSDIPNEINKLTALMKIASDSLDFEKAIVLRNEITELKKQLNKKD